VVGGGHAGWEARITRGAAGDLHGPVQPLNNRSDRGLGSPQTSRWAGRPQSKTRCMRWDCPSGGVIGRLAECHGPTRKRVFNAAAARRCGPAAPRPTSAKLRPSDAAVLQHPQPCSCATAMVTGPGGGAGGQRPQTTKPATAAELVGRITGRCALLFGSVYAARPDPHHRATFLGGQIWVGQQSH